jgi:hypothetical protein
MHLDIDGFDVALDNCTTGHITFKKEDFIPGSYVEYTDIKPVEGVGGTTSAAGCGLVRWTLTNQDDQVHLLILHNVVYVPTSPLRLLSPQQTLVTTKRNVLTLPHTPATQCLYGTIKIIARPSTTNGIATP